MAAKTTASAGFWDVGGTWTGGVVPVNGDTVTTNHAVTIRDARTVGASPAAGSGTNAIRVNADLTLAAGAVLTCRGDIGLDTGGIILQAGAILEFDASAAGTPSTALYTLAPINFNPGAGTIVVTGTSGSRCTIRSNSGGGNGRISAAEMLRLTIDYCDFQRVGDSTHSAIFGGANNGDTFHIGNSTFDSSCGPIGSVASSGIQNTATMELINVTHRGAASVSMGASSFSVGGSRLIQGCRFFGSVFLYKCDSYVITDTIIEDTLDVTAGPWTNAEGNMFVMGGSNNDWPAAGPMLDNYVLFPGTPINRHGFTTLDVTADFDGFIFDGPDALDGAGDCLTFNNPGSAKTIEVRNCILLPNAAGVGIGSLSSCLGGANLTLRSKHNTYCSGLGVYIGETYPGHDGMLQICESNIGWNETVGIGWVIQADPGVTIDTIHSAAARNNGKWNPSGTGYSPSLSFSSGSPGTGDINGDPDFFDRTRNIKTWDASLGGPGTVANALTELRKKNDASGYNSAYNIADLMAYIREGFTVQNLAMRTGSVEGTVMGAVQDAPPVSALALVVSLPIFVMLT